MVLPIANGGTGSSTQNFVDLTSDQTITGTKIIARTTDVTGLIVRRASIISELPADVFKVTDADGSNDLFRVTANGQLHGDYFSST